MERLSSSSASTFNTTNDSRTQLDKLPATKEKIIRTSGISTTKGTNGPVSSITVVIATTYHTSTALDPPLEFSTTKATNNSSRPFHSLSAVSTFSTSTIVKPPLNTFRPRPPPGTGKGPIPPGAEARFFNLRTPADFLMASLIPVLATTLLSIAIQVLTSSLDCMLPFRALGNPSGPNIKDSLLLPRSGGSSSSLLYGPNISSRFLRQKDPLPILNFMLSVLSAILVPLSSEVIRLEQTTVCEGIRDYYPGLERPVPFQRVCAYGLRKQETAMRIAEALLVAMALLVMAIGYLLRRWRSGVPTAPWSMAAMARLYSGSGEEFRELIRSIYTACVTGDRRTDSKPGFKKSLLEKSRGSRFRLQSNSSDYGIEMLRPSIKPDETPIKLTTRDPVERTPVRSRSRRFKWFRWKVDPDRVRMAINTTAFVVIGGLLILILYYENTIVLPDGGNGFEGFMNGQSFSVRILFTALGTVITLFWEDYFSFTTSKTTTMQSHVSPPTHIFDLTSIYHSMVLTRDFPALSIAVACFLAKFTPILLSNVPFRNTVTFEMHEVSTWMVVGVLGYMVVVLGCAVLTTITIDPKGGLRLGGGFGIGKNSTSSFVQGLTLSPLPNPKGSSRSDLKRRGLSSFVPFLADQCQAASDCTRRGDKTSRVDARVFRDSGAATASKLVQ
ncbi:hypothetical protein V8F20_010721 [Naviculisporaceae sp. PSN 640]